MTPINNDFKEDGRGRPPLGMETMTEAVKVRMDKQMLMMLTMLCKELGISREAGIREGIILFIRKYGG